MDGAVHTAPAPQFVIGCVDDSVYLQFGNVAPDKSYRHDVTPLLRTALVSQNENKGCNSIYFVKTDSAQLMKS
jgi:hypothetical protein